MWLKKEHLKSKLISMWVKERMTFDWAKTTQVKLTDFIPLENTSIKYRRKSLKKNLVCIKYV